MKALMFGWEFPPHILGGLGTASYGLTKGMAECGDMDITFVIPKPYGDEDKSFAHIVGAGNTPVVWRDVSWEYVAGRLGYCMNPQEYFDLRDIFMPILIICIPTTSGASSFRAVIPITSLKR